MIEMSVRAVKRAGEERLVAVLEREPDGGKLGRLLVTISRPEAHVLYHELRSEKTLPGQTYELMAEIVGQLRGRLTAVELVAGDDGNPAGRLRLERPDGRSIVQARAGQALALSVHLKVPLLVSEALLGSQPAAAEKAVDSTTTADTTPKAQDATVPASSLVEVPEVFLRAFDE